MTGSISAVSFLVFDAGSGFFLVLFFSESVVEARPPLLGLLVVEFPESEEVESLPEEDDEEEDEELLDEEEPEADDPSWK